MMEESNVISDDAGDYDSFDEQNDESGRPAERWAPLGAAADPKPPTPVAEHRLKRFVCLFVWGQA